VEAVQDGRIYIERVNAPSLAAGGTADDFRAGIERAVAVGWLWRHDEWRLFKAHQERGRVIFLRIIHRQPNSQEETDKAYDCHPNKKALERVHDPTQTFPPRGGIASAIQRRPANNTMRQLRKGGVQKCGSIAYLGGMFEFCIPTRTTAVGDAGGRIKPPPFTSRPRTSEITP
jgi:hypothetical protein